MKYNLEWLKDEINHGYNTNYIFFWREFKSNGEVTKSCLSQWFHSPFTSNDYTFNTTEHYMMARKALLFRDKETFIKIIKANTPNEAKTLGRQVKNFDEAIWDEHKLEIVVKGNLLKFSQNKQLQDYLISTNDSIIVEASPYDRIWGIGLDEKSASANDPFKWNGKNLLGFALMKVRDKLKRNDVIS